LGRIAEQAERLHQLILDMLSLARIESGQAALELSDVDVAEVASRSIAAHEALAAAKGVALVDETASSLATVRADDEGLREILDNLIDNAVKYTPPGGRVVVRARPIDRYVAVEVEDTGVGIPAEHLDRVFERFYRVDKARSRELGGTGLGLSIVKHLAQSMGGQVAVESEPGRGSVFSVRLPLASVAPPISANS
jgi:two-component system phosphate regulon sensor histidine kinase PhoR